MPKGQRINSHCWHVIKFHVSNNRTEQCCICGTKHQVDRRARPSRQLPLLCRHPFTTIEYEQREGMVASA